MGQNCFAHTSMPDGWLLNMLLVFALPENITDVGLQHGFLCCSHNSMLNLKQALLNKNEYVSNEASRDKAV